MNDEETIITKSIKADAQAVSSTVSSKGWQTIIRPALDEKMKALVMSFGDAVTYEEFVRIQQAMNAISGLLSFIEVKLIEGDKAFDELQENSR